MYNNPYVNNYNQQNINDRIDSQIAQLQQMKEQIPNAISPPPAINQTFQLAPNGASGMKYVETINDVKKEIVYMDMPFFSKDMSVLWVKNAKGDIKAYTLAEIIQKDEKDIMIESLQYQIEELKKGIKANATKSSDNDVNESTSSKESTNGTISKTSKSK